MFSAAPVQTVSGSIPSGTSLVLTVTKPLVGNILTLAYCTNVAATTSIAQTGVTWTQVQRSGAHIENDIWLGNAITSSAGTTITLTVATGISIALVQEWPGARGTNDQKNTISSATTTLGGASITPTTPNQLIFATGATDTAITAGPTNSFVAATGSPVTNGAVRLAVAFLIQGAAGAISTAWTDTTDNDSQIASFFADPVSYTTPMYQLMGR